MFPNFPLFPKQASTLAGPVDALYFFLIAVTAFFSVIIAAGVIGFAIRFRRRHPDEIGHPIHGSLILELTWTLIPLAIAMVIFVWGAGLYFKIAYPPADATEVYVVGKRWMWKVQHVGGQREINELHVPVGQAVKLIIGSEDVIHSFYIPDFRVKMDAVPGRSTMMWFEATTAGEYHLFCAEYCGMSHSRMIGKIVVMEPPDFQTWLAGGKPTGSMADEGAKLFTSLGCSTCHLSNGQGRGPKMTDVFGSKVALADGSSVTADENYIRESIMTPTAKIVAGYAPLMPTFQGQVSEEQLTQLLAYIKSLKQGTDGSGATSTSTSASTSGTH
jgi:cytochrome c oxidase subunit 2